MSILPLEIASPVVPKCAEALWLRGASPPRPHQGVAPGPHPLGARSLRSLAKISCNLKIQCWHLCAMYAVSLTRLSVPSLAYLITLFTLKLTYVDIRQRLDDWWQVLSLTRWACVVRVVCTQCMQSAWRDCHSAIPGISNHFLHSQAHLCRYTAETCWLVTSLSLTRWACVVHVVCTQCRQSGEIVTVPFLAYICNHFLHSQAHLFRYTAETLWLVTSLSLTCWACVVHVVCRQCMQPAQRVCHSAIPGIYM